MKRAAGDVVLRAWDAAVELGAIGPDTRRGRRFGALGADSVICFPPNAIFNEQYIHIGSGTLFGPQITLSAGMVPGQQMVSDPVISVGDRCLIGKGSGIVGHLEITIGNDVWTGHHVYITDQNSNVWALTRDSGATVWKQDGLLNRAVTTPAPFNNYIVVGDYEGYVHLLSRYDGSIAGRVRVDSAGIRARPLVVDDTLYVYGNSGKLAAYALAGG